MKVLSIFLILSLISLSQQAQSDFNNHQIIGNQKIQWQNAVSLLPQDRTQVSIKNVGETQDYQRDQYLCIGDENQVSMCSSPQSFTFLNQNDNNRQIQIFGQKEGEVIDLYLNYKKTLAYSIGYFGDVQKQQQTYFEPLLQDSVLGNYFLKNLELNQYLCSDQYYDVINQSNQKDCLWRFKQYAEPEEPASEDELPDDGEILQIQAVGIQSSHTFYMAMTQELEYVVQTQSINIFGYSYNFILQKNQNKLVQIQGHFDGEGAEHTLNWKQSSNFSHIGLGTFEPNQYTIFNFFNIDFVDSSNVSFYLYNKGVEQYLCYDQYYDEPTPSNCSWAFKIQTSD